MMKAINGYRLDSEAKFSSYAYSMIEGEIKHHLRDTALVKRPRWARSLHAKVSEATSRLTTELGRPPLIEEVAREVNITPEGVSEVMKLFCDTDVLSLRPARMRRSMSRPSRASATRPSRSPSRTASCWRRHSSP